MCASHSGPYCLLIPFICPANLNLGHTVAFLPLIPYSGTNCGAAFIIVCWCVLQNVLISQTNQAKLADVGLAKVLRVGDQRVSTVQGFTWQYSAPEVMLLELGTFFMLALPLAPA